jgi:hypothetical protein
MSRSPPFRLHRGPGEEAAGRLPEVARLPRVSV